MRYYRATNVDPIWSYSVYTCGAYDETRTSILELIEKELKDIPREQWKIAEIKPVFVIYNEQYDDYGEIWSAETDYDHYYGYSIVRYLTDEEVDKLIQIEKECTNV